MGEVMALGNLRGRGRRAGTGAVDEPPWAQGRGPTPWAAYPASGGPNTTLEPPYGSGPVWRANYITAQVPSTKVFDGGPSFGESPTGSSAGRPIYGMLLGLGPAPALVNPSTNRTSFTMGLGRLGRLGELGQDEQASLDEVVDTQPQALDPVLQCRRLLNHRYSVADVWHARSIWLSVVGAAVAGYHGYHRATKARGWTAAGWGAAGWFFPVLVTGIALYQGVGKK